MIWFALALIFGYLIYSFSRDRDRMLAVQVDRFGGMSEKYKLIITELTNDPNARVAKVTRDHIHIHYQGAISSADFFITETFNKVEISWVTNMGRLGQHKKKWEFHNNYPQEKILGEIQTYLDWKSREMFGFDSNLQ